MNGTANLLSLPSELREKIFHYYFKVDGGYVYNADSDKLIAADNSPIELSLIYTCRSIANDTKHIPLAVNTIKFSTLYREDWRGLAGCFNFVSTYHHLISSDLVVRLAQFMTPEMYSQLELDFPSFVPQLKEASRHHEERLAAPPANNSTGYLSLSNLRDGEDEDGFDDNFTEDIGRGDPAQIANWQSGLCGQSFTFVRRHLQSSMSHRHEFYGGFRRIDRCGNHAHPLLERWSGSFSEVQGAISYCLRLMAEKEPAEFSNLVYGALPYWKGLYPAHDFLNMGFDPWAIPSHSEVSITVDRFQANDAWKLLDMWYHTPSRAYNQDNYLGPGYLLSGPSHEPHGVRCREKIRFSAAAAAIRFLRRLSNSQRVQIRRLVLCEDLPSVNAASAHVQGLIPFFKENPLLRVERRVSIFGCLYDLVGSPSDAAWSLQEGLPEKKVLCKPFVTYVACWLFDALAVVEKGIPAESFTFVLEAGPHADFCSDLFQRVVHRDIAWHKAFKACVERGFLVLEPVLMAFTSATVKVDEGLEEAIEHLLNQTSALRCDFNPGLAWNFETVVDETKHLGGGSDWLENCMRRELRVCAALPSGLKSKDRLADNFEIQTEDDYLQLEPGKEHDDLPIRATPTLE